MITVSILGYVENRNPIMLDGPRAALTMMTQRTSTGASGNTEMLCESLKTRPIKTANSSGQRHRRNTGPGAGKSWGGVVGKISLTSAGLGNILREDVQDELLDVVEHATA